MLASFGGKVVGYRDTQHDDIKYNNKKMRQLA